MNWQTAPCPALPIILPATLFDTSIFNAICNFACSCSSLFLSTFRDGAMDVDAEVDMERGVTVMLNKIASAEWSSNSAAGEVFGSGLFFSWRSSFQIWEGCGYWSGSSSICSIVFWNACPYPSPDYSVPNLRSDASVCRARCQERGLWVTDRMSHSCGFLWFLNLSSYLIPRLQEWRHVTVRYYWTEYPCLKVAVTWW